MTTAHQDQPTSIHALLGAQSVRRWRLKAASAIGVRASDACADACACTNRCGCMHMYVYRHIHTYMHAYKYIPIHVYAGRQVGWPARIYVGRSGCFRALSCQLCHSAKITKNLKGVLLHRVHVSCNHIVHIRRPKSQDIGTTLRPKYTPKNYMDPLGS